MRKLKFKKNKIFIFKIVTKTKKNYTNFYKNYKYGIQIYKMILIFKKINLLKLNAMYFLFLWLQNFFFFIIG